MDFDQEALIIFEGPVFYSVRCQKYTQVYTQYDIVYTNMHSIHMHSVVHPLYENLDKEVK